MRYQFRKADGDTCCSTDNPEYLCEACVARSNTQRRSAASVAAPDPYAAGLAALRAANATPASSFEERWKAERRAALRGGRA
jgi:hypothetical protein